MIMESLKTDKNFKKDTKWEFIIEDLISDDINILTNMEKKFDCKHNGIKK